MNGQKFAAPSHSPTIRGGRGRKKEGGAETHCVAHTLRTCCIAISVFVETTTARDAGSKADASRAHKHTTTPTIVFMLIILLP